LEKLYKKPYHNIYALIFHLGQNPTPAPNVPKTKIGCSFEFQVAHQSHAVRTNSNVATTNIVYTTHTNVMEFRTVRISVMKPDVPTKMPKPVMSPNNSNVL